MNLDLIYGLPEQTLSTWQTTVKRILDLHPEHISAYALTLEHGTPFGRWSSKGILPFPDPDLAAEMYEWVSETLEANGYVQYEISNWAKLGPEAQERGTMTHILTLLLPAVTTSNTGTDCPTSPSALAPHGYANGYRYSNVLRIKTYIERLANPYPHIISHFLYHLPLSITTNKPSRMICPNS